jgi:protoporphyrinogen oxidase
MAQAVRDHGGSIRLSHEVRKLRIEEGRVTLIAGKGPEGPFEIEPEQVISTLPLPQLFQALDPAPPGDVLEAVKALPFASTVLVYGLFDQPRIRPDNWLYFPDRDVLFTRTYEVNSFDRGNVPEGQSCLCLEVPCREGDEIWGLSEKKSSPEYAPGCKKWVWRRTRNGSPAGRFAFGTFTRSTIWGMLPAGTVTSYLMQFKIL